MITLICYHHKSDNTTLSRATMWGATRGRQAHACGTSFWSRTGQISPLPLLGHGMWRARAVQRGNRYDSPYQSTLDAVYVYEVPWSQFPIIPSYPHMCGAIVGVPHRLLLPSYMKCHNRSSPSSPPTLTTQSRRGCSRTLRRALEQRGPARTKKSRGSALRTRRWRRRYRKWGERLLPRTERSRGSVWKRRGR